MIKMVLTGLVLLSSVQLSLAADKIVPTANGIEIPKNYKNWRLIGSSHRLDKGSLRVILGNTTAIRAARSGATDPWPDGTILAKLVWRDSIHPNWEKAIVPGEMQHAEFMIKDSRKYQDTGGWGFARWLGMDLKPYGVDASRADQECFACHTGVKKTDYVFTRPVLFP